MKERGQTGTALMLGTAALLIFIGAILILDAQINHGYEAGVDDFSLIYQNGTLVEIRYETGSTVQAEGVFEQPAKDYQINEHCEGWLCTKEYTEISTRKFFGNVEYMVAFLFFFIALISLYMAWK